MFYTLSKILGYLFSPAIWLILLFLWSIGLKRRRKGSRRIIIALILSYLLMNPFLTDEILRMWESPIRHLESGQTFEAALVLGGNMVNYDKENMRFIFRRHTDRFLQAYLLYSKGVVQKIIISGGPGHPLHPDETEALFLYNFFKDIGVPSSDLFYEINSRNTFENAIGSKMLIEQSGIKGPTLLITSAVHMPRALACFEAQGIDVISYPTDFFTGNRRYDAEHLFIPSVESLVKWKILMHEMIGYIAYKFSGYFS